jgi:SAM-dependent methyltransferase
MTMGGALYAAPVSSCRNILDIATGTGLWAIEFAQEHPEALVVGTDLSPIQPSYVPPNVQLFIEDCEDDWAFSQKFDLIHGRALLSCFTKPKKVMRSIFDSLTPGGYFELQDIIFPCKSPDGTLEGTSLQKWQDLMLEGLRNLGKDFEKVKEYGNYMREAGLVDIVERKYVWALGPWVKGKKEKLQARWWAQNFLDGINGWSMAIITRGMGWTKDEVEVLLEGVRKDVKNVTNRSICCPPQEFPSDLLKRTSSFLVFLINSSETRTDDLL